VRQRAAAGSAGCFKRVPKHAKPPVCFSQTGGYVASGSMGAMRLRPSLWISKDLRLRLTVRGRRRAGAVLRHELVELFLVLGVAQAIEEILELVLLFLEAF